MEDEAISKGIFSSRGGYQDSSKFDPSSTVSKVIFSLRDRLRRRQTALGLPEAFLGFLDNPTFNGVADKIDGKYYIGINGGVFNILLAVFLRLLSHKGVLTHIGNPEKELDLPNFEDPHILSSDIIYDQYIDDVKPPICPIRRATAYEMFSVSLKFLMMHEYTHIVNGHVDYKLAKRGGGNFEEEVSLTSNVPFDSLTMQTLEWDADFCALLVVLGDTENANKNFLDGKHGDVFYQNLDEAIGLSFFAIYIMHRLFGYRIPKPETLLSMTHPPSGLRQYFLLTGVLERYTQVRDNKSLKQLYDVVFKYILMSEEAFNKVSNVPTDGSAFLYSLTEPCRDLVASILGRWNEIRSELALHSFYELSTIDPSLVVDFTKQDQ